MTQPIEGPPSTPPNLTHLLRQPAQPGPTHLTISEVFGPTLQGEGLHVGAAAWFIRLAGCPVGCHWCDTKYSWHPNHIDPDRPPRTELVTTVAAMLPQGPIRRLVITGGEPLIQTPALTALTTRLHNDGWAIELETSGILPPGPLTQHVKLFTVSPKLSNSGIPEHRRLRTDALQAFAALPNAVFKFIAATPHCLSEVDALVTRLALQPQRVIISPLATTAHDVASVARELAEPVLARGWSLSPRWHITLWDDEPGR